ncbi:MAG: hypothetical protein IH626_17620 [Rhodospirillales bacterium]|nr:hypothetical protein [Rhodospirillales bacterium]
MVDAWGLRFFLLDENDGLWRVSQRVAQELITGRTRLPQFASKRVRAVDAYVTLDARKPVRLESARGSYWNFDKSGRWFLPRSARGLIMDTIDFAPPKEGNVVPLSEFSKRLLKSRERWKLSPHEITLIVHAIWPEQAGRPTKLPPFIQGNRERKPPMTYEAKNARSELSDHVFKASLIIDRLSPPSLKALVADLDDQEPDDMLELWRGIADACRRKLAIEQARRRDKGEWRAEVEVIRWEDGRHGRVGQSVFSESVQTTSRKAAVKAGRELLKKHADHFDTDCTVEVNLLTGIEWERRGAPDSTSETE